MESPETPRTRNKLSDALKADRIYRQKSFEAKADAAFGQDPNFHLNKLLNRESAFPGESGSLMHPKQHFDGQKFEPGSKSADRLASCKVLVVGAGGLGCELLKDLALNGFKDLTVVDADIIDITNLNRQFLFRMKDVGSSKSQAASAFIKRRCPDMTISTRECFIQKIVDENSKHYEEDFYEQFDLVICGLDNLEARAWMSDKLISQVKPTLGNNGRSVILNTSTVVPMIDGGTEGFNGQIHVTIPWMNLDFGQRTWMFPERNEVPLCTIASNPRKPEHCVAFAMVMAWPEMAKKKVVAKEWKTDRKYDTDSPDDMRWLTLVSVARAKKYNIAGVLQGEFDEAYFYTMGVVKSIIPAIASTNAMISAMCVQEAFKMVSHCSRVVDNFALVMGTEGMEMQYQQLQKDGFLSKLPLEIGVPYPKDENDTTVGELLQGISHSENYHMMAMKFGHVEFNDSAAPTADTIQVYTSRYKKNSSGEFCKTRDLIAKRDAVIMEAGPTITIAVADLAAAGGTEADLKQLIAAAAKKAGEDWADHFYVSTMDKDLLRTDFEDEAVTGNRFCTIPGLRNIEVVSPWIGSETELSAAALAEPVAKHGIDTESELTVQSEFMFNQRPVKVTVYLDMDASDEEEEEEDDE